jgi:XTP/dITP diphosphohydrolase
MERHPSLYGTTKAGKLAEARGLAEQAGIGLIGLLEAKRLLNLDPVPDVIEEGRSYEVNAARKARSYAKWSGYGCFADDSGLEIACLRGLPGVFTARFGFERVRGMLSKVDNLEARLVCCVAYAEPSGRLVSVTKYLSGTVVFGLAEVKPTDALPFSHIFKPKGEYCSISDLLGQKDATTGMFLSHRGKAFSSLLNALA